MNKANEPAQKQGRVKNFLARKDIVISVQRYLIGAMGHMALGLFASLLIGTIFETLGSRIPALAILVEIAAFAKGAAGPAMAVAIAYALKAPPMVLFSCVAVGVASTAVGDPVTCLIATIIAAELGKAVSKETKLDIIVTPSVTILSGVGVAMLVGPQIKSFMGAFGQLVMATTELQPFWMGIVVSVLVGVALTLPISSAALCIGISLGGLAAGAATAGCCAQMIGFAVMSFRENRWGGLLSQGLGTSMLQMPNIIRNPRVWIPPTLAAAITGPIATMLFRLENIPIGAGMGTSGLVGPIGIVTAMPEGGAMMWVGIITICFVLPAVLTWAISLPLRKIGWIKDGDLTLDLG
jgi:uncharacterized membrane protein